MGYLRGDEIERLVDKQVMQQRGVLDDIIVKRKAGPAARRFFGGKSFFFPAACRAADNQNDYEGFCTSGIAHIRIAIV